MGPAMGLAMRPVPESRRSMMALAPGRGRSITICSSFYALDTTLDLPANTTREDPMKAMDGHVIGKAAWFGRFHAAPQ